MKKTIAVVVSIMVILVMTSLTFAETKYTIQLGGFKTEEGSAILKKKLVEKDYDFL